MFLYQRTWPDEEECVVCRLTGSTFQVDHNILAKTFDDGWPRTTSTTGWRFTTSQQKMCHIPSRQNRTQVSSEGSGLITWSLMVSASHRNGLVSVAGTAVEALIALWRLLASILPSTPRNLAHYDMLVRCINSAQEGMNYRTCAFAVTLLMESIRLIDFPSASPRTVLAHALAVMLDSKQEGPT